MGTCDDLWFETLVELNEIYAEFLSASKTSEYLKSVFVETNICDKIAAEGIAAVPHAIIKQTSNKAASVSEERVAMTMEFYKSLRFKVKVTSLILKFISQ